MKERKVRVLTALMLMVLAVVATFNITYFSFFIHTTIQTRVIRLKL